MNEVNEGSLGNSSIAKISFFNETRSINDCIIPKDENFPNFKDYYNFQDNRTETMNTLIEALKLTLNTLSKEDIENYQ